MTGSSDCSLITHKSFFKLSAEVWYTSSFNIPQRKKAIWLGFAIRLANLLDHIFWAIYSEQSLQERTDGLCNVRKSFILPGNSILDEMFWLGLNCSFQHLIIIDSFTWSNINKIWSYDTIGVHKTPHCYSLSSYLMFLNHFRVFCLKYDGLQILRRKWPTLPEKSIWCKTFESDDLGFIPHREKSEL